jgi:CheY-like chemotaxis protein
VTLSTVRICVLEPDAAVAEFIRTALTGHDVALATSVDALMAAITEAPTQLVIVHISSERALTTPLLDALATLPNRPPVLAILASFDEEMLSGYLRNAIDDALLRPFSTEALQLRVRLISLGLSLGPNLGPTAKVLRGAVQRRASGEVFVRTKRGVGRVLLAGGDVAWVHCPWRPNAIKRVLESAGVDVDASTVADVMREARERAIPVVDVVESWGLLGRNFFQSELREELTVAFDELVEDSDGSAMMIPSDWTDSKGPRFEPREVIRKAGLLDTLPPPPNAPLITSVLPTRAGGAEGLVRALSRLRGARACALIELGAERKCVAKDGAVDLEIAWSLLGTLTLKRPDGAQVSENYCVIGDRLYGMWRLSSEVDAAAAFVMFDLKDCMLGLVLRQVRDTLDEHRNKLRAAV